MDAGEAATSGAWPILIIDDDFDIRSMMQLALEMNGYPVRTAASGREALAALRADPRVSLILLDLMMPVMNGWEFRAVQRSDPRLADLPIAVLSGDNEVAQVAAQLGAAGYLSKPISLEALLALVAAHQGRPKI